MRALVIDDSRVMRGILRRFLEQLRYEVGEAADGSAGLDQLRRPARPDVVLVDWNMPGLSGLEFVQAVRAQPDLAGVRLMMVTTENEMDRVAQALEAGADEFLMKPFTAEEVVTVDESLEGPHHQQLIEAGGRQGSVGSGHLGDNLFPLGVEDGELTEPREAENQEPLQHFVHDDVGLLGFDEALVPILLPDVGDVPKAVAEEAAQADREGIAEDDEPAFGGGIFRSSKPWPVQS